MKLKFNSLYWKISGIFLLLLLILGSIQIVVSVRSSMNLVKESDQKLNRTLAHDLAAKFSPFLKDSLDYGGIEHTIHDLMVMNPRVEIYLLDESGSLIAYFADPDKIKRMSVNVRPIEDFLSSASPMPIYGDDPRSLDGQKVFSVSPILIKNETPGFLYVILGGEQYDTVTGMVEDSHIIRTGAITLILIFVFAGIIGLILFFLLTKRLGKMTAIVKSFEKGDYEKRIPLRSEDEIGQLSKAFNRMADTILAAMREIEKNDALRRELIANISHDLRSPLASVQGYLETVMMKESSLSKEERQHFLQVILDNVTMLNTLVHELFELSKLDAKDTEVKPEKFSLAELIQDVVLKFNPEAEKRDVHLSATLPKDLPFAYGDIGMIERVLSNLINNALSSTPLDGKVSVELIAKQQKLEVKVSDTGIGIPTEDLPHIFDRFYRVEKSRSRSSGGSGLGLAIAKKILEAHDSEISVQSTVDTGTTFAFELTTYQGN